MDNKIKKLIIIGHVDTGKSTLLGNILYSSGNIDEHYMNNIRKEAEYNKKKSFQYAYLLDTDDTEKQKGITPGQFAAWYLEKELIGSGVIA